MKTFIALIIMLCLPTSAFAYENCSTQSNEEQVTEQIEIKTDVPKFLEGAQICVKLADGKESCVPAEKFKVVARKQQFIITKTSQKDITLCTADKEKNRVSLLAGAGPEQGLDVKKTPSKVTVESQSGAVGGLQYQRLITDDISIGAQIQTNDSALINIGFDF